MNTDPRARVVRLLALALVVVMIGAAGPASATGGVWTRSSTRTTVAGEEVVPLLNPSWNGVRRHHARLYVGGRNVPAAESVVVARATILARPGSTSPWCISRNYSYTPLGPGSPGTLSIVPVILHADGTKEREAPLEDDYLDGQHLGEYFTGSWEVTLLDTSAVRRGDRIRFVISIDLDHAVYDFNENILVQAC